VGQRVAGADAGRPNDRRAFDPLAVTEVDRMLVDTHDRSTELDFDAARFELSLRVVAGALGKGRQETRCHVDQHDANPLGVETKPSRLMAI